MADASNPGNGESYLSEELTAPIDRQVENCDDGRDVNDHEDDDPLQ